MSADAYDRLMDLALLDDLRVSPLFRVFWCLEGWKVCSTNLEGDPVSEHSLHKSMRQAYDEASRLNQRYAGIKPIPLTSRKGEHPHGTRKVRAA